MDNHNYGVAGNLRSAPLVSVKGSIDWRCLPDIDSPSMFSKLLDNDNGGSFEFITDDRYSISQRYICRTNVRSTELK